MTQTSGIRCWLASDTDALQFRRLFGALSLDFAHHGLEARHARMERTNRTQSLRVLRVGTARRGGGY